MVERLKHIPYYGFLTLLAYMPFHIFLSQWLSTFTGGLDAWKVAKDVFTMALVLLSFGLVVWTKKYKNTPYLKLAGLSILYLALHIILYFTQKETTWQIAALATVYNNRLLWFLVIGMSAVLLTPKKMDIRRILRIVLIISTITCAIAVAQFLLPKDIMTHFGYSVERGVKPAFFIDDKADLPRVMSTIRDPNSFGAFLIVPITLLWTYLLDRKHRAKRMLVGGLLALHSLTLFLTFSRGAWVGVLMSLAAVTVVANKDRIRLLFRRFWPLLAAALIALTGVTYVLRDQYVFQNILFHSDETTTAELDSNDLHLAFAQEGVEGIAERPLGYGPGTAGIVSIQDEGKGLLTENYFIQIGHEVGIFGLALFLYIWADVTALLLHRKQQKLAAVLGASIFGYIFIGMVAHVWTNETVAAQWWLLAGLLVVTPQLRKTKTG